MQTNADAPVIYSLCTRIICGENKMEEHTTTRKQSLPSANPSAIKFTVYLSMAAISQLIYMR